VTVEKFAFLVFLFTLSSVVLGAMMYLARSSMINEETIDRDDWLAEWLLKQPSGSLVTMFVEDEDDGDDDDEEEGE